MLLLRVGSALVGLVLVGWCSPGWCCVDLLADGSTLADADRRGVVVPVGELVVGVTLAEASSHPLRKRSN